MTLAQLRMLMALHDEPNISAADLARLCFITPQSMQAVVTRAEQMGWIQRQPSAHNRRVLVAALTPSGRRVHERGQVHLKEIGRRMWENTKLSEMEAVKRTLSAAVQRLQPERENKPATRRKTA